MDRLLLGQFFYENFGPVLSFFILPQILQNFMSFFAASTLLVSAIDTVFKYTPFLLLIIFIIIIIII